jgi:DNA-binding protein HU-beta
MLRGTSQFHAGVSRPRLIRLKADYHRNNLHDRKRRTLMAYIHRARLDKLNASVSIGFPFFDQEACVIKLDIVNAVVSRTNVTRTKAEQAVETVFESMKSALGRGRRIELRRFGVFNVKPRKTGIGRNPRTGQEVNIPPGKAVRFKPGKELQSI